MKICVLYGGRSGEHEVSLRSAASVVRHLDYGRHSVLAIGIDKSGGWQVQDSIRSASLAGAGDILSIAQSRAHVCVVPGDGIHANGRKLTIDCVFPVMHGAHAEDGTLQGLLEIAGLPYVGAGVLGSAASMDKEIAKRLWWDAGLPIVSFEVVQRNSSASERRSAAARIGWPLFVKPCAAGSSLGASRVVDERELDAALAEALQFDTRALLETCVDAREIECAVIGNSTPRALVPGEIVPAGGHAFYDYDAKYVDPNGAALITTADLEAATREKIMRTAEAAYAAVRCAGMARVDFFLERRTGAVFLNEINTIPGFTSISMFPRMCEASGLSYSKLLDTLIESAVSQHAERQRIRYEK